MTIAELLEEYPQLEVEDIYACIAYDPKCHSNVI
jgi:uncharacterized protein (DUF433 family)